MTQQGGEALGRTTASMAFIVVAVSEYVVGPLLQRLRWLYEVIKAPSQATGNWVGR